MQWALKRPRKDDIAGLYPDVLLGAAGRQIGVPLTLAEAVGTLILNAA
ncbi:hypothetical protein SB659_17720 [Arthrobacter sp. SIMBA_036]